MFANISTRKPTPTRTANPKANPNAKGLGEQFGRYRLYHAFRHFIVSLRPSQHRAAVPLDHALGNLLHIIEKVKQGGGRVILASEGLSPDPGPLHGYNEMMMDIAEKDDSVRYANIAEELHTLPSAEIFLDDCHLTPLGHRLVAERLGREVSEWHGTTGSQP